MSDQRTPQAIAAEIVRDLATAWRERACQQRALVHRGESVNPAAMTGMADAREDCADELESACEAIASALSAQQKELVRASEQPALSEEQDLRENHN